MFFFVLCKAEVLSTKMGVSDFGSDSCSKDSDGPCLVCNFTFRVLGVSYIDAVQNVDFHCRDLYQIACSAEGRSGLIIVS
jgi:hypothetical protein